MHWPNLTTLYQTDTAGHNAMTPEVVAAKFNTRDQPGSRRLTIIGLVDALGQTTANSLFVNMDGMSAANAVVKEVINVLRSGGDVDVHHKDFKAIIDASSMSDPDNDAVKNLDANQLTLGEASEVGGKVTAAHIERVRGWI